MDHTIDIVSRLGEAFSFDDLDVVEVDVDGILVSVVSPSTLYRMKRGSLRPRDRDDAERLRHAFDVKD